jgi:hypothetical protein
MAQVSTFSAPYSLTPRVKQGKSPTNPLAAHSNGIFCNRFLVAWPASASSNAHTPTGVDDDDDDDASSSLVDDTADAIQK